MGFEDAINRKVEGMSDEEVIDRLVSEFPSELHERLWNEIDGFDSYSARDYLTSKLIDRKIALLPSEYREIPKFMEVITTNPDVVVDSIERAKERGGDFVLGSGQNGTVLSSTTQEGICYKTLFMERARSLAVNVAREALLQNSVYLLMEKRGKRGCVPRVDGFVKTDDVMAIKMEKINGISLRQYLGNPEKYPLPVSFDIDAFFAELMQIVEIINEEGYFHRDLYENAGNIMCTHEGKPVLIDFGSAVRAVDYDPGEPTYQIIPNGHRYHKNDLSSVAGIKSRVRQILTSFSKDNDLKSW